jgi:hypothetical protein
MCIYIYIYIWMDICIYIYAFHPPPPWVVEMMNDAHNSEVNAAMYTYTCVHVFIYIFTQMN